MLASWLPSIMDEFVRDFNKAHNEFDLAWRHEPTRHNAYMLSMSYRNHAVQQIVNESTLLLLTDDLMRNECFDIILTITRKMVMQLREYVSGSITVNPNPIFVPHNSNRIIVDYTPPVNHVQKKPKFIKVKGPKKETIWIKIKKWYAHLTGKEY